MVLKDIHDMRVLHKKLRASRIDPLTYPAEDGHMTTSTPTVLVLGGTGTTGSRLVPKLTELGVSVSSTPQRRRAVRLERPIHVPARS